MGEHSNHIVFCFIIDENQYFWSQALSCVWVFFGVFLFVCFSFLLNTSMSLLPLLLKTLFSSIQFVKYFTHYSFFESHIIHTWERFWGVSGSAWSLEAQGGPWFAGNWSTVSSKPGRSPLLLIFHPFLSPALCSTAFPRKRVCAILFSDVTSTAHQDARSPGVG